MKGLFVLLLGLLSYHSSLAQVYINEVCPRNESILKSNTGDFEDWIELYNHSQSPIDLSGYYLSDDSLNPKKWKFPGVTIPAKSYQVVFASGNSNLWVSLTNGVDWKINDQANEKSWKSNYYSDNAWKSVDIFS